MERLQAGQDAALNDLMARHATPVFHFLCRMIGNEEDANDLAQETFVRVFKSCGSFRPREKFSTWLFTIAANLARNHFRWRSRHPNVSLDAENAETGTNSGRHTAGESPAPNEAALAGERAAAVRCRRQIAGGFARGHRAVRMGGTQRGRGGGDSGNHAQGGGIAAVSRPADFARTVEAMAVACCRHIAGRSI